jgi:hypothetical protein
MYISEFQTSLGCGSGTTDNLVNLEIAPPLLQRMIAPMARTGSPTMFAVRSLTGVCARHGRPNSVEFDPALGPFDEVLL